MRPQAYALEAALILLGVGLAATLGAHASLPGGWGVLLAALGAAGAPTLLLWRERRTQPARNKAEQLRFLQEVVDALPHPVFLRDGESRFLVANRAYAQYLGKPRQDVLGLTPGNLALDPETASLIQEEDRRVIAGQPVLKEIVCPPRSGPTPCHLVVSKECCRFPDGETLLVGSYFDVSQWRHTEQALQDSLQRETALRRRTQDYIQRLINVIPQPVYIKDADSRYVLVNDAFCRERGRERRELTHQLSYALAADEALRRRILDEDAVVLSGRAILKEEHLPHMYTGQERYRLISKHSCIDADGKTVIVGANFDITPWRVAERQLKAALEREVDHRRRTQDYIQRLIDVIPHPVYVKNTEGRYTLVNEAFARDRQSTPAALLGRHWQDGEVSNSAFCRMVSREDTEVLTGLRVLKEEHKSHPITGKERFRVIAKGSCLDADSNPVIVCAVFDVTDWRIAEARWMTAKEAAERANEAKSHFLANMSHELRTPMHAILSFARLGETRTRDQGDEKLHHHFERIVFSGERLLGLLNDLLDLSKLEAGRVRLNLRPLDVRISVQEALTEFSALLETRGVSVHLVCQGHSAIKGDAALIGQVLRNLLSNAIKFSPRQSVIEIGICRTEPNEMLEIQVRDQGMGIPENELQAVFDKFYQSSQTRSGAGGTGLGLAICHEIVSAHKGEILARNRASGGAEFVLRLPALANDPQPSQLN